MKVFKVLVIAVIVLTGINAEKSVDIDYVAQGKLSELSGDYKSAIKFYNSAIKDDSANVEAHVLLGNVYHELDNFASALEYYNKANKLDPENEDVYFSRANLNIDMGNTIAAISDFTNTLMIDPNHMKAYLNRGFAYAEINQLTNAINDYSIAIQINPDEATAYYNMAKVQGIISDADKNCSHAVDLMAKGDVQAELVYLNFCI